jgi:hypothetical protein
MILTGDVTALRIELKEFDDANRIRGPGPVGARLQDFRDFDRSDSFAIFIFAETSEGKEILLYAAWSYRVGDQVVHADAGAVHELGREQGFHLSTMATRIEYRDSYSVMPLKDLVAIPEVGPVWRRKAEQFRFRHASAEEVKTYSPSLISFRSPIYCLSEGGLSLMRWRSESWKAERITFHGRSIVLKNEIGLLMPMLRTCLSTA